MLHFSRDFLLPQNPWSSQLFPSYLPPSSCMPAHSKQQREGRGDTRPRTEGRQCPAPCCQQNKGATKPQTQQGALCHCEVLTAMSSHCWDQAEGPSKCSSVSSSGVSARSHSSTRSWNLLNIKWCSWSFLRSNSIKANNWIAELWCIFWVQVWISWLKTTWRTDSAFRNECWMISAHVLCKLVHRLKTFWLGLIGPFKRTWDHPNKEYNGKMQTAMRESIYSLIFHEKLAKILHLSNLNNSFPELVIPINHKLWIKMEQDDFNVFLWIKQRISLEASILHFPTY